MQSPERLTLRHDRGESSIFIGGGACRDAEVARTVVPWLAGRTVFFLTTPRLRGLYGEDPGGWRGEAAAWVVLEAPDGEPAKTPAIAEAIWREMLRRGGKRDSRLVTFGGGALGDLGGFVAGTFLRGISSVALPTTLLAQADASLGGKAAVDLPEGKNSVGLFHHPHAVVSDLGWLATLPAEELRSGLLEIVKVAFVLAPELLDPIEGRLDAILRGDQSELGPLVAGAARAKLRVVAGDLREGGARRLLNFGHTLGHALEAASGYRGLRHGEAVGYGMLFALRLAESRGLDGATASRLRRLLGRFPLPPLPAVTADELATLVARDKKATEQGPVWILPRRLGHAEIEPWRGSDAALVEEVERFLEDPFAPHATIS